MILGSAGLFIHILKSSYRSRTVYSPLAVCVPRAEETVLRIYFISFKVLRCERIF